MEGGLYRRLTIMIEAIRENCAKIDALFFLRHEDDHPENDLLQATERRLSQEWGIEVAVSFCRRDPPRPSGRYIGPHLKTASNFFRLPGYSEFSGTTQITAVEKCLARRPGFVFVHRLHSILPLMLTKKVLPPVFLDLDDIEHIAMLRNLSQPPHWWRKKLDYLQLPALLWGERNAIKLTRATFVCSDLDQDKLTRLFRLNHVMAVPNAVPLPAATPPSDHLRIAMLGNYEYGPNRLGAEFFLNHVWPLILADTPAAEVIFAGRRAETIEHYSHPPPRVSFPGFVDDLDEFYRGVRLVICPILTGGGTRVKIMEAAAFGRPVVSTTIGAEGISLIDGKEILLRDSPKAFSNACVELLTNHDAARGLGLEARKAIEARYNRSVIVAKLSSLLRQAIG
jgi:glycosyltransferase involved in cell wall biosynthesis